MTLSFYLGLMIGAAGTITVAGFIHLALSELRVADRRDAER